MSSSDEEPDFYQLEDYYELMFLKHLAYAKQITPTQESTVKKLAKQLVNSFRQLINSYVKNNSWTKFFNLIDRLDAELFSKCGSLKAEKLKLDELARILGDTFFKLDYNIQALEFYHRAISISHQCNLLALESRENLINLCIDRWHYRMMNDRVRNAAYSKSINKKLPASCRNIRVLDIGAGSGLLSAICLGHKLDKEIQNFKLVACEQNEVLYGICDRFLSSFNMNHSVKVIKKHSNDLIHEEDLQSTGIDIIFTEIFDDGLLGEGCLDTFYNLFVERKLTAKLIPESARVYVAGVESEFLRSGNYFTYSNNKIKVSCMDNSSKFKANNDESYEPYTTENLNQIDFKFLTKPMDMSEFRIRFNDVNLLKRLCAESRVIDVEREFEIVESGQLDAFILWFDLNLDDSVSITNSPKINPHRSINTEICECWHQAVYNIPQHLTVQKEQRVAASLSMRKDCFLINPSLPQDSSTISLELNRIEIALLNNQPYQSFYSNWFDREIMRKCENRTIRIGLLSGTFSVLLFDMILDYSTRLKQSNNCDLIVELFVTTEDSEFRQRFSQLYTQLQLNTTCININEIDSNLVMTGGSVPRYNLDYLVYEPYDIKLGVLRKNLISDLIFIKSCTANKGLKIFPSNINLITMGIESENLVKECRLVDDQALCIPNHDLTQASSLCDIMSDFATTHQYSLNPASNLKDMKHLTDRIKVQSLNQFMNETDEIKSNLELRAISAGRLDAVLYWYELVDENLDYLLDIDSDSSHSEPFIRQHHTYSPFEYTSSNSSNQLAALCFPNASSLNLSHNDLISLSYLFKNDIFHIEHVEKSETDS